MASHAIWFRALVTVRALLFQINKWEREIKNQNTPRQALVATGLSPSAKWQKRQSTLMAKLHARRQEGVVAVEAWAVYSGAVSVPQPTLSDLNLPSSALLHHKSSGQTVLQNRPKPHFLFALILSFTRMVQSLVVSVKALANPPITTAIFQLLTTAIWVKHKSTVNLNDHISMTMFYFHLQHNGNPILSAECVCH